VARAFFKGLEARDIEIMDFEFEDLVRANQIMAKYPDVPLGIADASVLALAERYRIQKILTLDRRHFSLFKPSTMDYFGIVAVVLFNAASRA
jgi:uncharacterized protein